LWQHNRDQGSTPRASCGCVCSINITHTIATSTVCVLLISHTQSQDACASGHTAKVPKTVFQSMIQTHEGVPIHARQSPSGEAARTPARRQQVWSVTACALPYTDTDIVRMVACRARALWYCGRRVVATRLPTEQQAASRPHTSLVQQTLHFVRPFHLILQHLAFLRVQIFHLPGAQPSAIVGKLGSGNFSRRALFNGHHQRSGRG
jgi:hypothetical protein